MYKNEKWLHDQYVVNEKSTREIGNLCNRDHKTILKWLDKFNIPTRSKTIALKISQNREIFKKKMSREKNWNWKDENVSINGLHYWAIKHFTKPLKCELCNKPFEKHGRGYSDWSRKNHSINTRNREDWQYVHHKCHIEYDKLMKRESEKY